MIRLAAASLVGAALALFAVTGQAAAEPIDPAGYAIGQCFSAGDVPQVKPTRFA